MDPAFAAPAHPTPVVFQDGLGERRQTTDPSGTDTLDMLCLSNELTSVPSFEFALRERVSRLASFRHPYYGHVRSVDRLNDRDSTLAIVSDATPGIRLSNLLAGVERHQIPLDINAALCLIRQLVPAIAMLHEHERDAVHGALAPERIIVTPRARLVIVEYVMGAALEQLRYSHARYWSDLRIALPRSAGLPRFDRRVDVTQIGVVALSLILGRQIRDDEYPARVPELVASAWATSERGDLEPMPPGLRNWLVRALQIDLRSAFTTANEAGEELDKVLSTDSDYIAEPATLEAFLERFNKAMPAPAPPVTPRFEAPAPRFEAPSPVAPRVEPPVVARIEPAAPGRPEPVEPAAAARVDPPAPVESFAYKPIFGASAPPRVEPPSAPARVEPPVSIRRAEPPAVQRVEPIAPKPRPEPVAPSQHREPIAPPKRVEPATPPQRHEPAAPPLRVEPPPPQRVEPFAPPHRAEPFAPPHRVEPTTPPQRFEPFAAPQRVEPFAPARVEPQAPKRVVAPPPPPPPPPPPKIAARMEHVEPVKHSDHGRDSHSDREVKPLPEIGFGQAFGTVEPEELEAEPEPSRGMPRWLVMAAAAVGLAAIAGGGLYASRRFAGSAGAAAATGTLNVTTNPAGAQVLIDGEVKGASPLTLTLKAGAHTLELRGSGEPRTIAISVPSGSQVSQYLELPKTESTSGQLQVRTDPPGATVTVDNVSRGTSPTTVGDLTPGEHTVVLASDLGSFTHKVIVEAGMTASLVVPMAAPAGASGSGWISVTAPVEVQLFESDKLLGTSQSGRIMLGAGGHQIEIVSEALGYRVTRSVQVTGGKVSPLTVKLPMGTVALNAIPWAEVFIDGEKVGETPLGNLSVAIGPHEIVFRHPDLGEQRHAATITLAAPTRLSVDLRKK